MAGLKAQLDCHISDRRIKIAEGMLTRAEAFQQISHSASWFKGMLGWLGKSYRAYHHVLSAIAAASLLRGD